MMEALEALGLFGDLIGRKHRIKFTANTRGIDHLALCAAGMNSSAVNLNGCGCSVEVFILDLAKRTAIKSVGVICAKALYVKEIRASADLLVGSKADTDLAVRKICVKESLSRTHDLGNACLIVCAKKGGAVGNDNSLTLKVGNIRIVANFEINALLLVKKDVTAIVVDHFCLDVLAGSIRRRVHVGDEAN